MLSSQCPYCELVLGGRNRLKSHLRAAQRRGICPDPCKAVHFKSYCSSLVPWQDHFVCQIAGCDKDFGDLPDYQAHIRSEHPLKDFSIELPVTQVEGVDYCPEGFEHQYFIHRPEVDLGLPSDSSSDNNSRSGQDVEAAGGEDEGTQERC